MLAVLLVPQVQAAVTATSSLHAAGAGAGVGLVHVFVEAVQVWVIKQLAVPHLHCCTMLAPEPHVGGGGLAHVFVAAVHFSPLLH